jgi:ABC-2 type transport system ATP-binding protein
MHHNNTNPPAISVRGLSKTWAGGVEAVKGIDFDVATGEVFGLLGPNGAGKSTTVGMLTTTVRPTSGSARLYGRDVAIEAIAARADSAVVFQDPVVDRALTGRRNFDIHARLWGVSADDASRRIEELADSFDLADLLDRPVATYSGGQRRRLEIARALVSEPRVLFLDEPTVGLDPRIRYELIDVISGLRARFGATVLLTTHYLDEAEQLSDRVAVLRDGRIAAIGRPEELSGVSPETEIRYRLNGEEVVVSTSEPTRVLHELTAEALAEGRELEGLSVRRPTLEEIYLALTAEADE